MLREHLVQRHASSLQHLRAHLEAGPTTCTARYMTHASGATIFARASERCATADGIYKLVKSTK